MSKNEAFLAESLESFVETTIAKYAVQLAEVSDKIWKNPELSFNEHQAAANLCGFLTEKGYRVIKNYKGLETAFVSEYQTANFEAGKHPCVAVLCEYDSLPDIGHACGHNLIAEAGVATFIAICEALEQSKHEGKVLCLGTPAEEEGGGKALLLEKGAFQNIDFAMMAHPSPINLTEPPIIGSEDYVIEFHGKAAHATIGPWEGINALDAAVSAYNSVSMLRQQLQPSHKVHMVIVNGGVRANVTPDHTKIHLDIRAPTVADMNDLRKRTMACFKAAALATGCELKCTPDGAAYSGLLHNKTMLSAYEHFGKKQGMWFPEVPIGSFGSTDMGNVSTVVPSIHPGFFIGGMVMIHTAEFQELAGKPEAHVFTCKTAIAMALTALELMINPQFRKKTSEEFHTNLPGFIGGCKSKESLL